MSSKIRVKYPKDSLKFLLPNQEYKRAAWYVILLFLAKASDWKSLSLLTVYLNFTIFIFSNFPWNATTNHSYWPNSLFFRVQVNLQYYKLLEYNYFNTTKCSTNVREGANISLKIKLNNNNNNCSPRQKRKPYVFDNCSVTSMYKLLPAKASTLVYFVLSSPTYI